MNQGYRKQPLMKVITLLGDIPTDSLNSLSQSPGEEETNTDLIAN